MNASWRSFANCLPDRFVRCSQPGLMGSGLSSEQQRVGGCNHQIKEAERVDPNRLACGWADTGAPHTYEIFSTILAVENHQQNYNLLI